jgi:hypothetical protein
LSLLDGYSGKPGAILCSCFRLLTNRIYFDSATTLRLAGTIKSIHKEISDAKITPFLWFDDQAEEAMNFYVSIFKNSKVVTVARYGEAGPSPKGSVMTAAFQQDGQDFVALNGGPQYKFTPAISLW